MRRVDMTGKRFGMLVVVEDTQERVKNNPVVYCDCDCGKKHARVWKNRIAKVASPDCGCRAKEKQSQSHMTHGGSGTSMYASWVALKRRGLVAKCWLDFRKVLEHFDFDAEYPVKRINPEKRLSPSNAFLSGKHTKSHGRKYIEVNGILESASGWAERLGVSRQRVQQLKKEGRLIARIKKDIFNEQ